MRFRQTISIIYLLVVFMNIHLGFFDEFIRLHQLGIEAKFVTTIICFHWIASIYIYTTTILREIASSLKFIRKAHWRSESCQLFIFCCHQIHLCKEIPFIVLKQNIHRLLSNWHCKKLTITKIIHEAEYTNLSPCTLGVCYLVCVHVFYLHLLRLLCNKMELLINGTQGKTFSSKNVIHG